uniref:Uncharacterized protein n=1 Tax=Trichobilharzia regenti TaxID=157069 RepID=A0AA85JJY7_TRIRE|nr:unnamed protein product [Trichobilharzia regenti]
MFHEVSLTLSKDGVVSLVDDSDAVKKSEVVSRTRIQNEKRLCSLDNLHYIYTRFCIISADRQPLNINSPLTTTELCFAVRQAIDSTIKDLFDDNNNNNNENNNSYQSSIRSWSIILAVPFNNVEKITAALSFMTNDLAGEEFINTLLGGESINLKCYNNSLKFYADVISVSNSLFNLSCIPVFHNLK